jgi:flagellar basal-body rod protein FlgB
VLSESLNFAQMRHDVLVGNVANLDTPGYQTRDLAVESFQEQLAEAIQTRRQPAPRSLAAVWDSRARAADGQDPLRQVRESLQTLMRHDGVNVGMEQQVLELSKNQFLHNLAITVMGSQFRLLQSMIAERV